MPTKSLQTSRPVQRTRTGRVVYDRPLHRFSIKDLVRVARNVDITATPEELLDAMRVIFSLHLKLLQLFLQLSPFYTVWWSIVGQVKDWLYQLWGTLTSGAAKPDDFKDPEFN